MTAADALHKLKSGNERYVNAQPEPWRANAATRREQLAGQKPFACIVTCSDSRVPAEIIFDQGLGDLFVIRVAGSSKLVDKLGHVCGDF